jgi:hypothetical protein
MVPLVNSPCVCCFTAQKKPRKQRRVRCSYKGRPNHSFGSPGEAMYKVLHVTLGIKDCDLVHY